MENFQLGDIRGPLPRWSTWRPWQATSYGAKKWCTMYPCTTIQLECRLLWSFVTYPFINQYQSFQLQIIVLVISPTFLSTLSANINPLQTIDLVMSSGLTMIKHYQQISTIIHKPFCILPMLAYWKVNHSGVSAPRFGARAPSDFRRSSGNEVALWYWR